MRMEKEDSQNTFNDVARRREVNLPLEPWRIHLFDELTPTSPMQE